MKAQFWPCSNTAGEKSKDKRVQKAGTDPDQQMQWYFHKKVSQS